MDIWIWLNGSCCRCCHLIRALTAAKNQPPRHQHHLSDPWVGLISEHFIQTIKRHGWKKTERKWRTEGIKIGKKKSYKKQIAKHKHQSVDRSRNRKLDSQELENASSINDSLYFSCYSWRRKKRSGIGSKWNRDWTGTEREGKHKRQDSLKKKESWSEKMLQGLVSDPLISHWAHPHIRSTFCGFANYTNLSSRTQGWVRGTKALNSIITIQWPSSLPVIHLISVSLFSHDSACDLRSRLFTLFRSK